MGIGGVYIGSDLRWLGARGIHCARAPRQTLRARCSQSNQDNDNDPPPHSSRARGVIRNSVALRNRRKYYEREPRRIRRNTIGQAGFTRIGVERFDWVSGDLHRLISHAVGRPRHKLRASFPRKTFRARCTQCKRENENDPRPIPRASGEGYSEFAISAGQKIYLGRRPERIRQLIQLGRRVGYTPIGVGGFARLGIRQSTSAYN